MPTLPASLPAARIRQNVLDLLETYPAGLTSAEMAAKRGGQAHSYLLACQALERNGNIYKAKENYVTVWRKIK